jgi:hypothetical protein
LVAAAIINVESRHRGEVNAYQIFEHLGRRGAFKRL